MRHGVPQMHIDVPKLILVRHGQAHANVAEVAASKTCTGLTHLGQRQAQCVAERLAGEPITTIWSSPILRAKQTAQAVARPHGLPTLIVQNLREIDYGDAEGKAWNEILSAVDWAHPLYPDKSIAPNAETYESYARRAAAAIDEILSKISAGTTVIVGHGDTITSVFNVITNNHRNPAAYVMNNAAITTWQKNPIVLSKPELGYRWYLVNHNDTSHLLNSSTN